MTLKSVCVKCGLACVAGGFKGCGWGAGNEKGGEAREGKNAGEKNRLPQNQV
jgi:hypothetical protein